MDVDPEPAGGKSLTPGNKLSLMDPVQLIKIITMHAAKTDLSRFVEAARTGVDVVIARGKEPLVRLARLDQPAPKRKYGAMKRWIEVPASFLDPASRCRSGLVGTGRCSLPGGFAIRSIAS